MSLISEALELQVQRKPRSVQVEAVPPFASRSWGLKAIAWVAGILIAVILGVWQGETLWHFVQKTTGFQGTWMNPIPAVKKTEAVRPANPPDKQEVTPSPPLAVGSKSLADKTANAVSVRSDVTPAAMPAPVLVALQTSDMDEGAEAEKRRHRRELAVRNLDIQGVRMQGSDSRALIHGVPVGLGEAVGTEGIKLKAIEASRLIFEDSTGAEFYKSY
jgi:hypothetical protein